MHQEGVSFETCCGCEKPTAADGASGPGNIWPDQKGTAPNSASPPLAPSPTSACLLIPYPFFGTGTFPPLPCSFFPLLSNFAVLPSTPYFRLPCPPTPPFPLHLAVPAPTALPLLFFPQPPFLGGCILLRPPPIPHRLSLPTSLPVDSAEKKKKTHEACRADLASQLRWWQAPAEVVSFF